MKSRRRFIQRSLITAGAASFAIGAYSWKMEPYWLEITFVDLPISGLPSGLIGSKLCHLSDLHIGPYVDKTYILKTFKTISDFCLDIIVYTGDFLNRTVVILDEHKRILEKAPKGSLGTFGVLGNHDYGTNFNNLQVAAEIANLLQNCGIVPLRNSIKKISNLQIVGLEDLWGGNFNVQNALQDYNPNLPALALSHNPDSADRPGWDAFKGWILSGHTHGGQIKPPFLPSPFVPVQNKMYTSGLFNLSSNRKMYINRGIGFLHQFRLNCRPEATIFTLKPVLPCARHSQIINC